MKIVVKKKEPITLEALYNLMKDQQKETKKLLKEEVKKAYEAGRQSILSEDKNYFKKTENKLKAYPDLKSNIERYEKDIEDLKKESAITIGSRRAKDIVFIPNGGVKRDEDELLQARIDAINKKKKIDQDKIDEIDYGLEAIKTDPDYMMIEYKYFKKWTDERIVEEMNRDKTTIWRNVKKLISSMSIRLYGGEVVS